MTEEQDGNVNRYVILYYTNVYLYVYVYVYVYDTSQ